MTFEDGMNHGGGWSPSEAALDYDRALDEELGRELADDLKDDLYSFEPRARVNQERRAA